MKRSRDHKRKAPFQREPLAMVEHRDGRLIVGFHTPAGGGSVMATVDITDQLVEFLRARGVEIED